MPKQAQEYIVLETNDEDKARKLIGFEVIRAPAFCEWQGKKISIPKESILRKDGLVHYETLSPGYELISHVQAFDWMIQALYGRSFELVAVSLECQGAEMTSRFRLDRGRVSKLPHTLIELTLFNSYNSATSLHMKLGSYHPVHQISAIVPDPIKSRWMHLGNKVTTEKFREAIIHNIDHYERNVLSLYLRMFKCVITKEQALAMVMTAIRKEFIPKKMGHEAFVKLLGVDQYTSPWEVFNALLYPVNFSYSGTPSHRFLIQKNIASAFYDGGMDLLLSAKDVSSKEVQDWIDLIKSQVNMA